MEEKQAGKGDGESSHFNRPLQEVRAERYGVRPSLDY